MEPREALEAREKLAQAAESGETFARRAAVLVGVLAAFLAIATLLGNQASEDIILGQEQATDIFNEYQADSLKQRIGANDAQIMAAAGGGSPSATAAAAAMKADSEKNAAKKAELLKEARRHEEERDAALRKHRSYQLAEGAFQIGIVLASIAIVARIGSLVYVGGALGIVGLLFLVNGVLSLVRLGGGG